MLDWLRARGRMLYVEYGAMSLLVMLPLLLPGFILTLDMVFVPQPPLPSDLRSSYLFHAALHVLSFVIPADWLQKIMLLAILLFAGVGAHKLAAVVVPKSYSWAAYFAGILFMVNPFVYSRFMAGQFAVLLGYALLPFFMRYLLRFMAMPGVKTGLVVAAWAVLISVVSLHSIGLMAVVGGLVLPMAIWHYRKQSAHLKKILLFAALSFAAFLVASSYWLIPLLQGSGSTAAAINHFNQTDRQAFATTGGSALGAIGNIIRLQGFWAEETTLFVLPQQQVPVWGLIAIILLALVVIGLIVSWRKHRFVIGVLAACGLVAIVIASGALAEVLQILPFFAGYREPHKFVGLLALLYAVAGAVGLAWVAHKTAAKPTLAQGLSAVLLLLPIMLTPTMLWGFSGQLKAVNYPDDWYGINETLQQEPPGGDVLFLPWHQYMAFQFAGRLIENPAPKFFERTVLASNDPEYKGIKPTIANPRIEQLGILVKAPPADFAKQLAQQNIRYVLLAKEYDFEDYAFLDSTAGLQLKSDTQTLKLYVNTTWEEPR